MKATQAMLIQTDGNAIRLLPAWPQNWNVRFNPHAPQRATVECEVKGGKIVKLIVLNPSRLKDVTIRKPFGPLPN